MRIFAAAVAALALMAGPALAFDRGPAIGQALPGALAATTSTGAETNFAALKGEKGLVLSFTRSADWCPYCQRQMIELQTLLPEIERRGFKLAVITTDTPEKLAAFGARRAITYPMLADPTSQIIDSFGLRDPRYPEGHRVAGVPVPSIFFIGADGKVLAKLGDDDYRVRPAGEVVISTLDSVD